MGNHQGAVQETRFNDVGNAPVDDHAGIENLPVRSRCRLAAEKAAQRRAAFGHSQRAADPDQHQQTGNLGEPKSGGIARMQENQADERRANQADDNPARHSKQTRQGHARHAPLHQNRHTANRQTQKRAGPEVSPGRPEHHGAEAEDQNEYYPGNDIVQHVRVGNCTIGLPESGCFGFDACRQVRVSAGTLEICPESPPANSTVELLLSLQPERSETPKGRDRSAFPPGRK